MSYILADSVFVSLLKGQFEFINILLMLIFSFGVKEILEKKHERQRNTHKIPHFDGHYDHWSELMENLLRAKGLWNLVADGYTEIAEGVVVTDAQRKNLKKLKMKDHQVKHYIFHTID